MERATQYELRLAGRMSRLGTETAFEVLNKARALEREGKEIIHLEIGAYLSANAVPIRLREDPDFSVDVDELASLITDHTKLIILNSPHNPTGGVLNRQEIHDIADAIGDRNVMVLSDEIYSRLVFEGEHYSIMSVPGFKDRTILLDGFSKTYAVTAWRMGSGVMRAGLAA